MLEYLVTSEVRRKLLRVLWADRLAGAVSELARLAGVGFASAHAELRQMEVAGLASSKREGNAVVYRARREHPQAHLLEELLGAPNHKTTLHDLTHGTEHDTQLNLVAWGAPLGLSGSPHLRLSLEATLARGLKLAHENATVCRALPVVFFKGRQQLVLDRLRFLASRLGEEQTLGFFLDLTSELSGDTRFHQFARKLADRRFSQTRDFFEKKGGRYAQALAEANTPKVAKKWRLRMNMGLDSFETLFRKFCESAA
jgi:hypothetical protein